MVTERRNNSTHRLRDQDSPLRRRNETETKLLTEFGVADVNVPAHTIKADQLLPLHHRFTASEQPHNVELCTNSSNDKELKAEITETCRVVDWLRASPNLL